MNGIVDLQQFHRGFQSMEKRNRLYAELNAIHVSVDWSLVTKKDMTTVLKDLASAEIDEGRPLYKEALYLMSWMIYQHGPVCQRERCIDVITQGIWENDVIQEYKKNGWTVGEIIACLDTDMNSERRLRYSWQDYRSQKEVQIRNEAFSEDTEVYLLHEGDGIYARRDRNGYLVLSFLLSIEEDVLADEEIFGDEPPLYFTASTHFRSPVWKLKKMETAIRMVVRYLEFSEIPFRYELVVKDQFCVINEEDMRREGWQELDIKVLKRRMLAEQCDDGVEWPQANVWKNILYPATLVYQELVAEKKIDSKKVQHIVENVRSVQKG